MDRVAAQNIEKMIEADLEKSKDSHYKNFL